LFAIWLVVMKLSYRSKISWIAMPSEKRIASYSSQHGDEDGYTLSLCCKFENNLRFFAIWLVMIKLLRRLKYEFSCLGYRAKGSQLFLSAW